MSELKDKYNKEIVAYLVKTLGLNNPMSVPRLSKIVVNIGLGEALTDKKVMEKVAQQLTVIVGQKPQVTKAKRAISTFKLRAGDPIGLKATLRGTRMYDFFAKLVRIALPRVRDFRGVPINSFDGNGNYSLGLTEQTIFPELEYSMIDKVRGLEITFVTTAKNNNQAKQLLTQLGMPFAKE